MKKEMVLDPLLVNSMKRRSSNVNTSYRWIRSAAVSTAVSFILLIILTLLLAIPITVLVIGTRYRDPRYCPIEPRISLFLIVHGVVSVGWIVFTCLFSVMTIVFAQHRPLVFGILAVILVVILYLHLIFSIIWLIVGSVWTFSVRNRVIHEYDTINHFYPYTYCHPVLYKFTYIYLIISYVLMAIQFCYQCCTSAFRSRQQT